MPHLPFSDREVERVLAGQQPYGRPELADVAYAVARLRALTDFESPPEMSLELRAQVEAAEARRSDRGRRRRRRGLSWRQAPPTAAPIAGSGVAQLAERRQASTAPRRWRYVAAAAVALALAGAATIASVGGWGEPGSEVETETASPPQTTTTEQPGPAGTEPPAASSGEPPARPSVPPVTPSTEVDTTAVPAEAHEGPFDGAEWPEWSEWSEVPPWLERHWPSECDWPDWDCACDRYGDSRDEREACREFAEQGP